MDPVAFPVVFVLFGIPGVSPCPLNASDQFPRPSVATTSHLASPASDFAPVPLPPPPETVSLMFNTVEASPWPLDPSLNSFTQLLWLLTSARVLPPRHSRGLDTCAYDRRCHKAPHSPMHQVFASLPGKSGTGLLVSAGMLTCLGIFSVVCVLFRMLRVSLHMPGVFSRFPSLPGSLGVLLRFYHNEKATPWMLMGAKMPAHASGESNEDGSNVGSVDVGDRQR